ncbi:hypothetical protein PYW08_005002 [Mythimna loreyi]|uniref:Uncharacterized protein n=2 Tax=Mythimna loreyi TaxID=667449 RepID=A0ACC2PZI1_9NEOP|nr:hypothetical protein PYW08_013083 [Mythimna loreyi]KAJ8715021.1 hypothetical protein PYW08_005002 [Mythimna loreyi]
MLENNEQLFRKIKEVEVETSDHDIRSAVLTQRAVERGPSPRDATDAGAADAFTAAARSAAGMRDAVTSPQRKAVVQTAAALSVPNIHEAVHSKNSNDGWEKVSYRRKRNTTSYRYLGSAGTAKQTEGNFKAVIKTLPIFITKVHKDTTVKDITDYVYQKTGEVITLQSISFKYPKEYNAYKFFVSETKIEKFLDSKLWPEGIIFRKFVNFKMQNNTNSAYSGTVSGLK